MKRLKQVLEELLEEKGINILQAVITEDNSIFMALGTVENKYYLEVYKKTMEAFFTKNGVTIEGDLETISELL